jgi:hypothetical protein
MTTEPIDAKRLGQAIFDTLHIAPNDEIELKRDRLDQNRIMVIRNPEDAER